MKTLIADIETDGLLDTMTTIHQISTLDLATGEKNSYHGSSIPRGIEALGAADRLVMHNGIAFDIPAIRKVTGVEINPAKCIDTLVLSRLNRPSRAGGHSLAAWAERLSLAPEKVEHEDWSQWSPEMDRRCEADVEITKHLYEYLKPMYDLFPDAIETEMQVAIEAARMVERGFTLDVDHTQKTLDALLVEQQAALEEMQRVFPAIWVPTQKKPKVFKKAPNKAHPLHGMIDADTPFTPVELQEFSPTARQQVAERLQRKYDWKPKEFTDTGMPKIDETVLNSLPYPEAGVVANYLRIEKMVGQINAAPRSNGAGGGWLHHLAPDGRVHPSFNPTGANTHRSSCSSPNLQQVSSDPEMRRCWVPQAGWTLVGVDAAGLELRCLAHYLARWDDGEYGRILIEGDIHSHIQKIIGFQSRTTTKTAEYAWLYGAGDAKLGSIARADCPPQHPISNTKLGSGLRLRLQRGVTGLGELVDAVKEKAKSGKLKAIDGRTLWVRSEHSALNLLLQSCGAIVIKTAWALMEDILDERGLTYGTDWATVIQVHDEWQIECRPECAEEVGTGVIAAIQSAGDLLNFRCPLDGSFNVGPTWADTH